MSDEQVIYRAIENLTLVDPDGDFAVMVLVAATIQHELVRVRCKREREWYEAREKVLLPKDKEYTDLDRTVRLEAGVAEVYEAYQYVRGLEELVQQRIELYKLMLGDK